MQTQMPETNAHRRARGTTAPHAYASWCRCKILVRAQRQSARTRRPECAAHATSERAHLIVSGQRGRRALAHARAAQTLGAELSVASAGGTRPHTPEAPTACTPPSHSHTSAAAVPRSPKRKAPKSTCFAPFTHAERALERTARRHQRRLAHVYDGQCRGTTQLQHAVAF